MAGVCWEDIDFVKKTVSINKAYMRIEKIEYIDGKIVKTRVKEFKDLKSTDSYRILGLQDELINLLKQHKEQQMELAKRNNKIFKETDWVFTTKSYEGYVVDYASDKFRNVMENIKIKDYKDLTLHDLRHSFCSIGIMNGVTVEQMKQLLGHSNISVTVDWYLSLDKRKIIEASNVATSSIVKYL